MDLADKYRKHTPEKQQYINFSQVGGMLSRRGHILTQKFLSIFKKIEIVSVTFDDYNVMKLEYNYMRNTEIHTYTQIFRG